MSLPLTPSGPKTTKKPGVPVNTAASTQGGADPHGCFNDTIDKVKLLVTSDDKLEPFTALLLIHMFPDDARNNNLDVRYLSKWKKKFTPTMKQDGLQAALRDMGFGGSDRLAGRLVSLFNLPTHDQIIDYNTFIQCCAIVEKHVPSGSSSNGGQMKNPGASALATPPLSKERKNPNASTLASKQETKK